jgi:Uma2 family endonuclease
MSIILNPPVNPPMEEAEDTGVRPRRWTREEYYRAAELGLFRPEEHLELIKGEIIQRVSPQKKPHFSAILKGQKSLEAAFGSGYHVRPQGPMRMPDDTEPEPDLLVVSGADEDYTDHPTHADAVLLVEIADTTLRYDLGEKAALYAEAGITDYWVASLPERCLYVHRDPVPMPENRNGFGYNSITRYEAEETVAPLAAPQAAIRVSDLLPRANVAADAEEG